jgi:precorrin-8X/cobalt-precorrin-8 methylmutase
MNNPLNHPIVEQSFAIIDQEVGEHKLNSLEYAIARRVIHATADFEYLHLVSFSPDAIDSGIAAIRECVPIITDVTMVKQGIRSLVAKTFNNPVIAAIDLVSVQYAASQAAYCTLSDSPPIATPGKTRTETGMLKCCWQYPEAII